MQFYLVDLDPQVQAAPVGLGLGRLVREVVGTQLREGADEGGGTWPSIPEEPFQWNGGSTENHRKNHRKMVV